ncbi:MAG: PAS domain-containing protein [Nocardioides sp.]|nr:PAS domain-containing protein [Nocardioides sp.]
MAESQFFDIVVHPLWDADTTALGTAVTFLDTTVQTGLQHDLKQVREDLETTNEELQASIEELETMNEEMQVRTTELDGARTFLEGILSSVAAAVVVLSNRGRVQAWNSSAEDMWGLRAAEVQEEPFFSLEFGLPVEQLSELVESCARERRRTGPVDVPAVNRKGRTLSCRVTCSPLAGANDGVVLLMEKVSKDDVTRPGGVA